MSTHTSRLFALLPCIFCFSSIAADHEKKLNGPPLSIEDAVTCAKEFAARHHIRVEESYINTAHLELHPKEGGGKYWLITWLRNDYANDIPIKGGQIYARIYMDRTAKVFFGE